MQEKKSTLKVKIFDSKIVEKEIYLSYDAFKCQSDATFKSKVDDLALF